MTKYGLATNKKITMNMYKKAFSSYNSFTKPSRLTKCRYELYQHGKLRKAITTDFFNREVVLTELIRFINENTWVRLTRGKPLPYIIYVTEKNVREVLIDSNNSDHLKFTIQLCKQGSSTKQ